MIDPEFLMGLVNAVNRVDYAAFRPWMCNGHRIGFIRHTFAEQLRDYPDVFSVDDRAVRLVDGFDDTDARSAAVNGVMWDLRHEPVFLSGTTRQRPINAAGPSASV